MTGRSPSGPGSRPSDRAAKRVSPVPASIPNAKWRVGSSHFGDYLQVDMPPYCDMIVVCVDRWEHGPITLLLPHQLYIERAAEILAEHQAHSLTIIPCRSGDKVTITAQAIEARRGETLQDGSVHESAVPEGNAPNE